MRAFGELSRDKIETKAKVKPPPLSGVEQSEEILEWIWENFSAVAGDLPTFECWREQLQPQAARGPRS